MSNQHISLLFATVLHNDVLSNIVTRDQIKAAIENMVEVYQPRPNSLSSTEKYLADYNTVAHRCAYLHKYAAFHTAMVRDALKTVLSQDVNVFSSLYRKLTTSQLKICSLGGGPGSDIVGIVAALSEIAVFQCSAKVVDLKADWENTLWSVVHELKYGYYGAVGQCFQAENFRWEYLTADLLENELEADVTNAIGEADLVTMVKFVSAASCKSTETMLMKIFRMLKSGSMVLFIDNASGGFSELVSIVSKKCNMRYVFGPINHKLYTNEDLKDSLCGITSCFSTKITIHMIQKQGMTRESNFLLQEIYNRESNFTVDQSGRVRHTDPIVAQPRWIQEANHLKVQAGWGGGSNSIVAQSPWDRASNFTVDQSVWLSETHPIVAQSRWLREPNPIVHPPISNFTGQSVWLREKHPIIAQSRWLREANPTVAQVEWGTESNFTVDQSGWDIGSNPLLPQSRWNIEPNPIVAGSRWNRGGISHGSSFKMGQRIKFNSSSIKIGQRVKFYSSSFKMRQRIQSYIHLRRMDGKCF